MNAPHLWIDPGFGASGDMLLGALAGVLIARDPAASVDEVLAPLGRLALEEHELRHEPAIRCGLSCHRMHVVTSQTSNPRHWADIDRLIEAGDLPDRAASGARATFRLLGDVEAKQHGVPIDEVHFHEVGAADSILDIVGAWLLVDALAPRAITVAPVGLGHGSVEAAHGLLPLPAPATVALLEGAPVRGLDIESETCTPTGAALLVTMANDWGPLPDGVILATSRGAGGRDPDTHPNVVTITAVDPTATESLQPAGPSDGAHDMAASPDMSPSPDALQTAAERPSPQPTDGRSPVDEPAWLIECNVDDATPEVLASAINRLLDAGANDAWIVPIVMKKGRAAAQVCVLADASHHRALVSILFAETGTLGCRTIPATKHVLPRQFHTVMVRGRPVDIKVGPHSAKPEHDHLVALADETGLPVRQLDLEARLAWEQSRAQT